MVNTKKNILLTALMTSLLIMGTSIVTMQSYAVGSDSQHKRAGELEDSIKKDAKSEKANQHLGQDNACSRGDDCQQANEGQQIVGKDNDAQGFNDQSKNIQQSVFSNLTQTPTPGTTSTPGNGTTPTPTTTTLKVCKVVVNRGSAGFQPSDFTFNFTTPANPASFQGDNEGCTAVTVAPGNYTFTEIFPPSLLSISSPFRGDCSFVDFVDRGFSFGGTIPAGETQTCAITNIID